MYTVHSRDAAAQAVRLRLLTSTQQHFEGGGHRWLLLNDGHPGGAAVALHSVCRVSLPAGHTDGLAAQRHHAGLWGGGPRCRGGGWYNSGRGRVRRGPKGAKQLPCSPAQGWRAERLDTPTSAHLSQCVARHVGAASQLRLQGAVSAHGQRAPQLGIVAGHHCALRQLDGGLGGRAHSGGANRHQAVVLDHCEDGSVAGRGGRTAGELCTRRRACADVPLRPLLVQVKW